MCKKLIFLTSFILVLGLIGSNVALGRTIEIRVAAGEDDAEEKVADGSISLGSSDLEITEEGNPDDNQLIGMRFANVGIPQGAVITSAYVQFQVDAGDIDVPGDNRPGTKFLRGEAVDDAASFTSAAFDISSRPTTTAEASWDWPEWLVGDEEGPDQQTSDISAVIQEIVDRPGWASGNSLALIITGSGENTADSFDGKAEAAPLLVVDFGGDPFLQDSGPDGIVSIEAENFHNNTPRGIHAWELVGPTDGFTGVAGMQSLPNNGDNVDAGYVDDSPRLDYDIALLKTGTYHVWLRAWSGSGSDDSCHVGLDGQVTDSADRIDGFNGEYVWTNHTRDPELATIDVADGGVHELNLYMREDGAIVDKIVLTTNPDYVPEGDGPPESERGYPVIAFAPSPADGAIEVDDTTLEWGAPESAVSYKVFVSTDETIDDADLVAETDMMIYLATLDPGATYYWRVDVVQADGTVTEGMVWTFDTLALEAHFPNPEDGAAGLELDAVQLSWTAGKNTIMHNVNFGTDPTMLLPVSMMQMDTSYDPGPLELATTYYWSVDEFTPTGTIAGPVWSFSTVGIVPVTDPNLLAYFDFERGQGTAAIDQSGHGSNGVFVGDPQWITGIYGGALDLDGDGDYLDAGTNDALNTLSDAITVSAWVNIRSVTTTWMSIVMKGETAWRLGTNGDTTGIHWGFTGGARGWQAANSVTELPLGQWHHIAATYDRSVGGTVYVDGIAETVNPDPDGVAANDQPLLIGENPEALGRLFDGLIDEVRIYNKALTGTQIQSMSQFDVTAPGDVVKGVPDEPRDGSVAGWPDGEYPWLAVDDDVSTKFLHFRGEVSPTGFVVEPASGPSIVTGLTFTTANDAIERDPVSFELSGSNDSIDGPYTLIASGDIVDFAQADAISRFTMNTTAISFANDVVYAYYQVMFPTVRDAGSANSMQIAEVELLGVPAPIARWEFDGDFEGGTPVGDVGFEDDPERGQVLSLPGGDDQYVDLGSVGISGNMPRTITVWAKADNTDIPNWTLIFGFTGTESGDGGNGSHFNIGSLGGPGGVGAHCWGWEETIFSDDEALEWHHYAMTYDGTTIQYYGDGVLKDTDPGKSNVRSLAISADRVHAGSRITQASSFPGKVDDARIYKAALSPLDISRVASE
ncbi:MAG: LamG-like jellyroll fold domain-containing protein [Planctomycetota bacterium]|jgi:hypothetical protein